MQETQVRSLDQGDLLERESLRTAVFLSGEFHGQRMLVGSGPWDHKESDMTEQITLSLSGSKFGKTGPYNKSWRDTETRTQKHVEGDVKTREKTIWR